MKNEKVIQAYEAALKRMNIDIITGVVRWGVRPRSDFASARYYKQWHDHKCGTLVGYKNGTRGGLGVKFMDCNLTIAKLVARKRWGVRSYDMCVGYKDGNNTNLSADNMYLMEWRSRAVRYKAVSNRNGFTGVQNRGTRFASYRTISGVRRYLGTWDTPEQAHAAYKGAC